MSRSEIPKTDSIQEMAQFWDAHDLTDFEAELGEVSNVVFAREDVLEVPLAADDMHALRELAATERRTEEVQRKELGPSDSLGPKLAKSY